MERNYEKTVNKNPNPATASLPCKAAKFASLLMATKFFSAIASLSKMASDKTTEDAPLAM